MSKRENAFQASIIKELKERFPGCIVLKNDSEYIQGIPDLLILFREMWAALECKRSRDADHRPNQDYYVDEMNRMSYASFIYPENKEQVLDEIQRTFQAGREARFSVRE